MSLFQNKIPNISEAHALSIGTCQGAIPGQSWSLKVSREHVKFHKRAVFSAPLTCVTGIHSAPVGVSDPTGWEHWNWSHWAPSRPHTGTRETFEVTLNWCILHSLLYTKCSTFFYFHSGLSYEWQDLQPRWGWRMPSGMATLPSCDTEHMPNKGTSELLREDTEARGDGERYDIDGAHL